MSFTVTATGQVYEQMVQFLNLGRAISANWDLAVKATCRLQMAWAWFVRYKKEIYDRPGVRLRLKVWVLKAEIIETVRVHHVEPEPCRLGQASTDPPHGAPPQPRLVETEAQRLFAYGTLLPRQTPRALRRRCADEIYCSQVAWHA